MRHAPCEEPGKRAPCRRNQNEEDDNAMVAGDRKRRRRDRRKTRRVNRVDLAVAAAAAEIRLGKLAGEVGMIVAVAMVVLDLEVVIFQQALRDDQVVRLVTAWNRR